MPQRLYLRCLCAKRAVCSVVPEFAAYFRRAFPEVRVKPRSADPTPVLRFGDLRFCWQKSGCARRFPIFPRTSVKHGNTKHPEAKTATNSTGKQPLKRKNRLLAVSTDQARRTVAKPHHSWHFKKNPIPINHYPDGMTTVELNRKADLRQVKRPPYSTSSNILNNALCIGIQVLHAEAKRLPIKCFVV